MHDGMVWVAGGEFAMGSEGFYPEEAPVRRVGVEGFWIDELDGAVFAWGDEFDAAMANTWQGEFPWQRQGPPGTTSAGAFPANGYGLFDMTGNVWEWTCEEPGTNGTARRPCCAPSEPGEHIPRRVIKGGSHLCAPNYCLRYRPAARQFEAVDTSTGHIGFRCVVRDG